MQATRERKERFILSFGKPNRPTGNDAVSTILHDYGLAEFSDWAIDAMVEDLIAQARSAIRSRIENRRTYEAFRAREAAAALGGKP